MEDAQLNRNSEIVLRKWLSGFVVVVFLWSLSYVTYSFYIKNVEIILLRADVVVNGQSLAPYQYRILSPYAIEFLKNIFGDYSIATKVWIILTITAFYFLSFYFFLKESGSGLLSMICCLALWGALPSGMWGMPKQEFLEATLILLLYHYQRKNPIRWLPIILVTVLCSLNRETYLIALIALGISLYDKYKTRLVLKKDWIFFAACFSIDIAIYAGLRMHYGLRTYASSFFMYGLNFHNFINIINLWTVHYAGAGIFWIYIFSVIKHWRDSDKFILAYLIGFLAVSFFISSWGEHRIFYPLYPLILLQVLHVIKKEFNKRVVS